MKRILVTIAVAGAFTLSGAAGASALDYPAAPAQGGVDTGSVNPGGPVTFTGSGMAPGEQVTVTISCSPGGGAAATTTTVVVVADAQGNFAHTAVMNEPGLCTLTAVGAGQGATVRADVTVNGQVLAQAAPAAQGASSAGSASSTGSASSAGLANTGVDASTALWGVAGIGALTLGTVVVAASRRRSKDTMTG